MTTVIWTEIILSQMGSAPGQTTEKIKRICFVSGRDPSAYLTSEDSAPRAKPNMDVCSRPVWTKGRPPKTSSLGVSNAHHPGGH